MDDLYIDVRNVIIVDKNKQTAQFALQENIAANNRNVSIGCISYLSSITIVLFGSLTIKQFIPIKFNLAPSIS